MGHKGCFECNFCNNQKRRESFKEKISLEIFFRIANRKENTCISKKGSVSSQKKQLEKIARKLIEGIRNNSRLLNRYGCRLLGGIFKNLFCFFYRFQFHNFQLFFTMSFPLWYGPYLLGKFIYCIFQNRYK